MSDDRLPMELGEDDGRPAEVEPVPAAGRQPPDGDPEQIRKRLRAAAEQQERLREAGEERKLANLQPSDAPIRHGVHARMGVYMRCDKCPLGEQCEDRKPGEICPHEQQYVERRTAELYRVEWIDPVIDGPTVKYAVWLEIRMERAARYIAMHGEIHDGEYLPVAKDVQGLHNSWLRTLEKLGLTPPARKAMADQGQGNLGELAAALLTNRDRVIEAVGQEEPIDAEFEAGDETEDQGNGDGSA